MYIHDVSPVKKSKKGNQYYNFKLQTNKTTHQGVSFTTSSRAILEEAAEKKSPVKLAGYKRKANFRDNNLQDIEINRRTSITLLDRAGFDYKVQNSSSAAMTNVKSIKEKGYDKQLVSVHGFMMIEDCYKSIYNVNSSFKEVYFNDQDDTISLALWNSCIDEITQSGVYTITNVIVKRLAEDEVPYISTTNNTVISKSSKKVKFIKPDFTLFKTHYLPNHEFRIY